MVTHSRASLGAYHLRALNLPRPAAVQTDAASHPCVVQLGTRWVPVAEVQDRWRIDDEWWRQRMERMYFLVILEDGDQVTLFHDAVQDQWFHQSYVS